jgi:hypothetical protein
MGKTTKFLPPNMKKLDRPPTKKSRSAQVAPEVHIAVNITPMLGVGSSAMQGSYTVSGTPIACSGSASAPGPVCPDQVGNVTVRTEKSCAMPTPTPVVAARKVYFPSTRETRFAILLDCVRVNRVPSVHELLTMMDIEDPAEDLKYIDAHSEMQDLQVNDVLDVYGLHKCFLATFGELGPGGMHRLRQFARNKLLVPLELVEAERSSKEPSIVEVAAPTVSVSTQKKHKVDSEDYDRAIKVEEEGREAIRKWLTKVEPTSDGIDEIEEVNYSMEDIEEVEDEEEDESGMQAEV